MHSTVQTGLFNQYNNEYNHHSSHYHPPPHMYYQSSPHHPYFSPHPPNMHQHDRHEKQHHTVNSSSANTSLLAVNSTSTENLGVELSHSSLAKGKNELSVSNPNIAAERKRRNSDDGSTSSGPPHINNNNNGYFNYQVSKGHETQANSQSHMKRRVESFWQCTKPCGVLTLIVGIFLLTASIFGFLLFLEQNLCHLIKTCSNSLVKIATIMALVIGIVLTFLGSVIVVYVKKDGNADIIITSSKNISFDQSEIRKMQEIKNGYSTSTAKNNNNNKLAISEGNRAASVNLLSNEAKNDDKL